ncbi:MAG: hypothetical protein CMM31_04355, partial [Rhodospirillaceae bacterium]|nr:hypothetical protein [Rhodospirillaceae bacterium]
MADGHICFYDSSLRAGALPDGGELSGADKLAICEALDGLGIDVIENSYSTLNDGIVYKLLRDEVP